MRKSPEPQSWGGDKESKDISCSSSKISSLDLPCYSISGIVSGEAEIDARNYEISKGSEEEMNFYPIKSRIRLAWMRKDHQALMHLAGILSWHHCGGIWTMVSPGLSRDVSTWMVASRQTVSWCEGFGLFLMSWPVTVCATTEGGLFCLIQSSRWGPAATEGGCYWDIAKGSFD